MGKFLKRSAIAGAAALAIMGGFSGVEDAVAHADTVVHWCTSAIHGQTTCWTRIVPDRDPVARCDGDHPSPFCGLRQQ